MLEEVLDRDVISTEILDAIRKVQVVDFSEEYIDEKLDEVDSELPEIVKDMEEALGIDYESRSDIWKSYFEDRSSLYYNSDEEQADFTTRDYDTKTIETIKAFKVEVAEAMAKDAKLKLRYAWGTGDKFDGEFERRIHDAHHWWKETTPCADIVSFLIYDAQ